MKRKCASSLLLLQELFVRFMTSALWISFLLYLQSTSSGEKSWEVLLGHVISELSKGKIYEEQETEELTVVLANPLRMYLACPLSVCYLSFSAVLLQ